MTGAAIRGYGRKGGLSSAWMTSTASMSWLTRIMRVCRFVRHDLESGYRDWNPGPRESVFEAHARLSPGDRI